MSNRVLVTGGFGNLGCWITREFLEAGWDVTVATSTGRAPRLLDGASVINVDLAQPESIERGIGKGCFDAVVHAGSLNDGFVEGYFWKSYRVNVEGTSSLLHHLRRDDLKHFIYFSTFHVYGASEGYIDEATPPNPRNDYATSHLAAEQVIRQHAAGGLPATVLRLTNGYGRPLELDSTKWHLVFNDLVRMAADKSELVLNSDPRQRRDFVWMGDVAKAVVDLARIEGGKTDTMNLGFGASISLGELAGQIRQAFAEVHGEDIPLRQPPPGEGPEPQLSVDCSKVWERLGRRPLMKLKEEAEAAFRLLAQRK